MLFVKVRLFNFFSLACPSFCVPFPLAKFSRQINPLYVPDSHDPPPATFLLCVMENEWPACLSAQGSSRVLLLENHSSSAEQHASLDEEGSAAESDESSIWSPVIWRGYTLASWWITEMEGGKPEFVCFDNPHVGHRWRSLLGALSESRHLRGSIRRPLIKQHRL